MKISFQNPTHGPLITVSFDEGNVATGTSAYALVGASRTASPGLATLRTVAQTGQLVSGAVTPGGMGASGGAGLTGIAGPLALVGMLFAAGDSPARELPDEVPQSSPLTPNQLRCLTNPYDTSAECAAVRGAMSLVPFADPWLNDPNAAQATINWSLLEHLDMPIPLSTEVTEVAVDTEKSHAEWGARQRLRSPNPVVQWEAWTNLYDINPEAARRITQEDLGLALPFESGSQGLVAFVTRPKELYPQLRGIGTWLETHHYRNAWKKATIDLRTVHPVESIVDFAPPRWVDLLQPDVKTGSAVAQYERILEDLVKTMGTSHPQKVLKSFVKQSWLGGYNAVVISIIQLPSGYRIIMNGHHRTAALVKAARDGIIPPEWLQQVPVEMLVVRDDFPIPEPVFLQIYAPAHKLTIDELLPPPDLRKGDQ